MSKLFMKMITLSSFCFDNGSKITMFENEFRAKITSLMGLLFLFFHKNAYIKFSLVVGN